MNAKRMALGGILAALAVMVLALGGLIPAAAYCAPVLASAMLVPVISVCGCRLAWAWYAAVAILGSLLCPDPETAAVFVFLGYYPIVQAKLNRLPKALRIVLKLLLFHLAGAAMYAALIFLLGLSGIWEEFRQTALALQILTVALAELTFLLTDRLLCRLARRWPPHTA